MVPDIHIDSNYSYMVHCKKICYFYSKIPVAVVAKTLLLNYDKIFSTFKVTKCTDNAYFTVIKCT